MLSPRRRRQFLVVVALMMAGALAELATIGAVIPFLSLLANPEHVQHVPLLASTFAAVGATTDGQRLLAATGLYRWVWHPALFDMALYLLLLYALSRLTSHLQ